MSEFFKKHYPDIKIAADAKKVAAIDDLAGSGSFAFTHIAISKLEKISDFTVSDAETLIDILEENSQVNLICQDKDVRDFYSKNI